MELWDCLAGPEGTAGLLRITTQLSSADISGDLSHEDAPTVTLQSQIFVAIPYILATCVSSAEKERFLRCSG